jgi:ADP-ribose pyrophosphatase
LTADRHLVETFVSSETLVQGGFLQVRRDTVRMPDGQTATRELVQHPGAVMVVPILDDGRLLLERQYRHPVQRVLLEFPAGKIDAGEDPGRCAVRELQEETGYTATAWARAGLLHNAAAYSTEAIEVWFARGLQAGQQRLDEGEFIELVVMSAAEVDTAAGRGDLTDAKTLIGLLWLQRWRAGAWPLVWRDAATRPA